MGRVASALFARNRCTLCIDPYGKPSVESKNGSLEWVDMGWYGMSVKPDGALWYRNPLIPQYI